MNIPVGFLGFADAAGAWLLTYLLHSTALLVPALLLGRFLGARRLSLQESVVRVALVGGLLTASLQVGMGWEAATGSIPYPSARSAVVGQTTPEMTASQPGSHEGRATGERESAGRSNASGITSAAAETMPSPARRGILLALAVGLWAATGLFLLVRLGVLAVRLGRSLRGRSELRDGSVFRLFWRLLAVADVDKPTHLTQSSRLEVPIALGVGRREICLPDRVVEELPQEQQETVLAHELAHLQRRDPAWLLFGRALESVLFVQPLNRVARRKLQEIAEYRCDDWAAEYTGRPLTLAKCLTAVATWSADRRVAALAPTLAGRRSGLGQRVRRLLDPAYSGVDMRVPGWWRPIAAGGLVAVIVAVPGFSTVGQEEAPEAPEPPAEAAEVEVEPAPPASVPEPSSAPTPAAPPFPATVPVVAPTPPSAVTSIALVEPALAPVAPAVPAPQETPEPVVAPSPPEADDDAAPLPAVAPSVAPDVEVKLAAPVIERVQVSARIAPKVASRIVVSPAPVKIATKVTTHHASRVHVSTDTAVRVQAEEQQERDEAQDEQDQDVDEDWDDEDWDDEDWDEELEDELDALEDEIDEMMDEIDETLEEEIGIVVDELEDELDALEDELEETFEAELEMFEDELEDDLEAFEEEMEELEDRVEERLETVGWESREEAFERDIERIEDSFDHLTDQLEEQFDRIEEQIEGELERILEPLVDDRLEAQLEVLEERLDLQSERLEEMAERMAEGVRARGERQLSAEERAELMAEARRVAEQARPKPEEIAALRAELDRLSQAARPSREELDRMRTELRQQLETLRGAAREGLEKQREDLSALRRKHKVL